MLEDKRRLVLEKVPGLAVSSGLRCCGGQWDDYIELLCSSVSAYSERLRVLRQAQMIGSWAEANQQIHALAGGLGFLGAGRLSQTAADLDVALREKALSAEEGVQAFMGELDRFLTELEAALRKLAVC